MSSPSTRLPRILGATLALGLGIFAAVPAGGAFAATPAPSAPPVFLPLTTPSISGGLSSAITAGIVAPTGTGSISGTVAATGSVLDQVPYIGLYADQGSGGWSVVSVINPDVYGGYSFAGLAAGNYRIEFEDSTPEQPHATEYYNNSLTLAGAQNIAVTEGTATENIDALMTFAGPIPTTRIAGATRYATSAAAADTFPTFKAGEGTVYIASGDNFPDALSAAPAAAASGGPLLLTPTNYEPAEIVAAITRLAPHRIVVVGGVNAVSADVFAAYGKLAPVIERISGADRYETSRLIAAAAFPVPVAPVAPTGAASAAVVGTRNAYLATGSNFPDALAASAAAGTLGEPVILVNGAATTVDAATSKLFTDLQIGHLRIAGGTAAVSAGLETALTGAGYSTERYAGATRYDTSVLINAIFDANNASGTVYLAVGTGYADALSGGALAAVDASPMFITPGNCVPVSVLQAILTLKATNVVLLGGPNALSAAVADLIECE